MSETKATYWSEPAVVERLRKLWPSPAYLLVPQVRNGTGYSKQTRTADALLVSCWPSRGVYLAGVEIKVSYSDWRREVKAPEKSQAIQQYCRYWWIAAPKDMIPLGELPDTWGLVECDSGSARVAKQAPPLEAKSPDVSFVAAVLRAVSEHTVPKAEFTARVQTELAQHLEHKLRGHSLELHRLREHIRIFEEASGVKIEDYHEQPIGDAVRLVRAAKGPDMLGVLRQLRRSAEVAAKVAGEAVDDFEKGMGAVDG